MCLLFLLSGSIPSRSRIRLSALKRLSCFFLNELPISWLIEGTLRTSIKLYLFSFPWTLTLFNPTSSTTKILHVNRCPSFSKAPRLFKSLTKSPFWISELLILLLCAIFSRIRSTSSKTSNRSGIVRMLLGSFLQSHLNCQSNDFYSCWWGTFQSLIWWCD